MSLNQASSPTGTSQLSDVINTEYLRARMEHAAVEPLVGELITTEDMVSPEGTNSYAYKLNSVDEMTGAAVVTENNAAPEAALGTTPTTINGSRIALRSFVLDASRVAIMNAANEAARGIENSIRDKYHNDTLALFTSLTNSEGGNTVTHTLSNHDSVMTAFLGQNYDPGQQWQVLNKDALRDLRSDLVTNAASLFGAAYGDRAANALKTGRPGLGVLFDNILTLVSGDTPAGDTTGWTNAVGVGTPGSELGALLAVVWQDIQFELQRDASRFGTWIVGSMFYGVGIRKQANARAFITKT